MPDDSSPTSASSPLQDSLQNILAEGLTHRPEGTALAVADGSIALSFRRLHDAAGSFAQQLRGAGVRPGDVVTLVMPNSIEFVVALLAITWARAIAAPLNPEYQAPEFESLIRDQNSAAVLDLPGNRANPNARLAAGAVNKVVWEANWTNHRLALSTGEQRTQGMAVVASEVQADRDVALFFYTSGTTSKPKGVPLTHRNVMSSVRNIAGTYELSVADRSLLVLPLSHVHGLIAGLLAPLAAGSGVYLTSAGRFSASSFWKEMVDCDASWYTAVPTIHQILVARYEHDYPRERPPRLRFIRSCSAPLARSVLEDMEAKFHAPVLEAYAMTEAAHQMTSNPLPQNGPSKPGSVGTGQNVAVAILDDTLTTLAPLQTGEICVRGDNVTQGYLDNPEANAAAFAGGWFHTGDQGYLDADGYLFITGRIKELINRGGEKIPPSRIDEVLLAHPAVAEASTFGVPDPKYGEEVNAAVVLKPGFTASPEDLTTFCLARLAAFQIPKRFYFADELPKTKSGKIQRKDVRDHFLNRQPNTA